MIDLDAYRARLMAAATHAAASDDREIQVGSVGLLVAVDWLDAARAEALPAADAPSMPPMNHTPTTQAMRKAAWPRSGSLRADIVRHLGRFPTTDDDLEVLTQRSHQSVSAARYQLVADGWLAQEVWPNGVPVTRRTRAGNPAFVWSLTRAAKVRLAEDARRDAVG